MVRFSASKVMARPQLSSMSPSITSIGFPSSTDTSQTTGGSITVGNPNLKPYRAKTLDFGYEWYFDEGSVLAVAAFSKWIKDVPQQVTTSGKLSQFVSDTTRAQMSAAYAAYNSDATAISATATSNAVYQYYVDNDTANFNATIYQNGPGGVLNGLEFTFQQQLKFLPSPFDGLGINANYTLIHSKQHYILTPAVLNKNGTIATSAVLGDGPWTGASPNAFNVTLFYDAEKWSGRVSAAYRSKYVSSYPIAGGNYAVGYGDSPIVNDFIFSKSTLNVDTSFTYNFSENIQFRIDATNLTSQTENRFAFRENPLTTKYAAPGRTVVTGFRLKY
jgi:iron complex outermembrane recepter protein